MITLDNAKVKTWYKVSSLKDFSNLKIKRRICQLGIFPGAKIFLMQKSILKKVILFAVNNYTLSLKAEIASKIVLEEV